MSPSVQSVSSSFLVPFHLLHLFNSPSNLENLVLAEDLLEDRSL